jgi:antitoxin (DNA-binding transcriptional repressor) of toxin-antitoxin stability system
LARFANVVTRDYIGIMKTVGVRELKAHLSRYLREVAAGDVVLVTDRGHVVAELRAPGAVRSETAAERALRRLAETGALRVGEHRPADAYQASPVRVPPGTARDLLDTDRADA